MEQASQAQPQDDEDLVEVAFDAPGISLLDPSKLYEPFVWPLASCISLPTFVAGREVRENVDSLREIRFLQPLRWKGESMAPSLGGPNVP